MCNVQLVATFDAGIGTLAFGILACTEANKEDKIWGCHLHSSVLRNNIIESSHFSVFPLFALLFIFSFPHAPHLIQNKLTIMGSCHFSVAYAANREIQMSHATLYS